MSNTDVLRASCAECPNLLMPDLDGNRLCNENNNGDCTWCTGGGDCEIWRFTGDLVVNSYPLLNICVSKYIFETPGLKKPLRNHPFKTSANFHDF